MHLASFRSHTIIGSLQNALIISMAVHKASHGVQRPGTMTGIKNGDVARQTLTSQTAWIVTTVVEIGQETENVWSMLLSCAKSARDPVVCVLLEEMDEEEDAGFRFFTKTDLCMTVSILIRRHGVQRQPTITRTRDGATVFPSVSSSNKINVTRGDSVLKEEILN